MSILLYLVPFPVDDEERAEADFLREGSDPYELTIPADMVKLPKEASGQHWDSRTVQRNPQPTKETTPEAIDLTMNTTENEPDSEVVYLLENETEEITALAPDEVEQRWTMPHWTCG